MTERMNATIQISIRSLSEADAEILQLPELQRGRIAEKDGILYLMKGERLCSCDDTTEGRELLEALSANRIHAEAQDTEENTWRSVLSGRPDPSGMKKYGIRDRVPRCVILFRPVQDSRHRIQQEMIPTEESDRIIGLDSGETALVLDMRKRTGDEAFEYAAAAAETMESEGGVSCHVGIGRTAASAGELSESLREAQQAIDTGIRHSLPGNIHAYERQTLERLADLIPEEGAEAFRKDLISPQAEKVLNEETLETIRVFFRNDLNVSTTARQLFIHRNTLMYRMEKIRKATGLDLRKFEDAVVFRMMMYSHGKKE